MINQQNSAVIFVNIFQSLNFQRKTQQLSNLNNAPRGNTKESVKIWTNIQASEHFCRLFDGKMTLIIQSRGKRWVLSCFHPFHYTRVH